MDNEFLETSKIGDILSDEFLDPLSLTAYRLAKEINVSTSSVLDLLHGRRGISVEMALRLSKYFGNSSKFWLNLQNELDLRKVRMKMAAELDRIPTHVRSA